MAASAIPAVIDWLLTTVGPELAADNIDLTEGFPGDRIQRDTVMIGGATFEHQTAAIGTRKHIEDATLTVWVAVQLPGGTATEARVRAFAIFNVIAELLRSSPDAVRIGGATCWATFSPSDWTPGIGDQARTGLLRCELKTHNSRI